MSAEANINVWTLGKGARGKWKLQLSTPDIEEATALCLELEQAGKQVALYELGYFEHEGQQVAGQVGFWWSENLNDYMEMEPQSRGVGWTDEFDTYVFYTVPQPAQVPALVALATFASPMVSERSATPAHERYVEAACEHCGKIMPKNELYRLTHEVKTGRTSGTTGSSRSNTSRASAGSFSNSTRNSSSSRSGRTYYRTETLLLCAECYAQQKLADRSFLQVVWDYFKQR